MGSSMGAAIAQTMAIEHPERLLTLTSMMGNTGEPEFGQADPQSRNARFGAPPDDRAAYIEAAKDALLWGSKKYANLAALQQVAAETPSHCGR